MYEGLADANDLCTDDARKKYIQVIHRAKLKQSLDIFVYVTNVCTLLLSHDELLVNILALELPMMQISTPDETDVHHFLPV